MSARNLWISVCIVALALGLRLFELEIKPAHFDEGVNGWFIDQMTKQGFYHYDPTNFHGPLHFYVLFVAQTLLGPSEWALRLPIVLLSTACVGFALAFRRYFSDRACQVAALMMAVSPGMVFYGRYAIHETWLVFFLMLTAWGLPGLWHFGDRRSLWATTLGIAGLVLTKETYVVHLIAFLIAAWCLMGWELISPSQSWSFGGWKITWRDWIAAVGISLGLIVFFYSGCFLDWPGPATDDKGAPIIRGSICGLWETFAAWTHTGMAKESGHEKEWWYWLQLLGRYEWPAMVGLVAGLGLLLPRVSRVGRYLAIYGLGALIGYSIIQYKTPWCVISLMWPFYFVLGLAVAYATEKVDRWVAPIAAGLLGIASLWMTLKLNWRDFDDDNEPYVYVQTYTDVNRLLSPLRKLARQDPVNYQIRGHVVLPESYPWLWTLGAFPRVDFPSFDSLPEPLDADFLIIDAPLVDQVEPLLRVEYIKIPIRIRGNSDNRAMLYLYPGTFASVVREDTPRFVPGAAGASKEEEALQ